MDQLDGTKDEEANPDGLDFIEPDTRINLLENKVVLAVPEGNPKNINSYDDMVAGLKDKSILSTILRRKTIGFLKQFLSRKEGTQ